MFFIGVFGIEDKEKEIKIIEKIQCKSCNKIERGKLIKSFRYFHFFFIPLFKWNEEYYLVCESCNKVFSIPKDKGKGIESGDNIEITYWDLKEINTNYNYTSVCNACKKIVDSKYDYCPYCGNKLR